MWLDIYSYLLITLTFGSVRALLCPQTLACLWIFPAKCPTATIKWGGPRCLGWALGRPGVDEAALGLTGSGRLQLSRERAKTSTRLHQEEKEAAKADSTQALDGLFCTLWKFFRGDWVTCQLKCLLSCLSCRIWGCPSVQSSLVPIRSSSEGAWWH